MTLNPDQVRRVLLILSVASFWAGGVSLVVCLVALLPGQEDPTSVFNPLDGLMVGGGGLLCLLVGTGFWRLRGRIRSGG